MAVNSTLSSRALARRAKAYLRRHELELFVPVLPPFEEVAADELLAMGFRPIVTRGGVSFHGDLASIYDANLSLRTGSRVLFRVRDFFAHSYPMIYNHTRKIPWEALLGSCPTLGVRATFKASRLRNREHIADVVFDAISARLADLGLTIERSSSPALVVHARLAKDHCTLSQDTTGDHLHKRGYRVESFKAPLRETTAASLLALARADEYDVIVDPFCGSGTIAIEADLLLQKQAPGLNRHFAIECTPLHSAGTMAEVRRKVGHRHRAASGHMVLGFDYDAEAVALARRCASRAGTTNTRFATANALTIDFDKLLGRGQRGLVASNVPYGIRLESKAGISALLEGFVNRLRVAAGGWDFAIICPTNTTAPLEKLGIDRRVSFSNGGIPASALLGRVRQ